MKICVLALDRVFDTGLATVLDAFSTANELAEMSGITSLRFDISIVGVRSIVLAALSDVALLASFIPAKCAANVDPLVALRHD
jgi:ABC-type lipoprotein release transport system permease subunit